jgi:hypothetical protein
MNLTEKRYKRGDVREDGMVFFCYDKTYRNGERWVTTENLEERKAKKREYDAGYYQTEEGRTKKREHQALYSQTEEGRAKQREANTRHRQTEGYRSYRRRYRSTPEGKAANAVRQFAIRATKYAGQNKPSRSFELLGTDLEGFKAHMESQFLPGMSWENHGEWHIDHIIPLASGKTPEEIWKLCHYTNLQPLWASDNLSKGAKLLN